MEKFTKRTTPSIYFANCGHGQYRSIEDCASLNYISAGHGIELNGRPFYFSNFIRKLIIGDILCVYRNKVGYVGIAKVVSEPMTISRAYLGGKKVVKEMFSEGFTPFEKADIPGYAECLVEVEWLTPVHTAGKMASGMCYGRPYFASRITVCSMQNQTETIKALEKAYKINDLVKAYL